MVRMITDDEKALAEEEKRRKGAELLELKKRLTEIVDDLKAKLNKAVEELKKLKDENAGLQQALATSEERVRNLESELIPLRSRPAKATMKEEGRVSELERELERSMAIITARDEELTALKLELEAAEANRSEPERRTTPPTLVFPSAPETVRQEQPVFTIIDEDEGPQRVAPPRPSGRLLGAQGQGTGLLGRPDQRPQKEATPTAHPLQQRPPRTFPTVATSTTPADAHTHMPTQSQRAVPLPVPKQETPPGRPIPQPSYPPSATPQGSMKTETPARTAGVPQGPARPMPPQTDLRSICPVCGGEGVIGVRRRDGSIVQEICPNCKGVGKV